MKKTFENEVLANIVGAGINPSEISVKNPIGAAVSGGADSVSLLVALARIFEPEKIKVITVNHGIRSKNESDGDAAYVKELCEKFCIECAEVIFENGEIVDRAKEAGKSIEEAARTERYKAFYDFIEKYKLSALCIAHNLNDQTETLLMRFLTGSGVEGLFGITGRRDKIIRPLLTISRERIEAFLKGNGLEWKIDSTNSDLSYLRNRIRNVLVPVLNEHFPSWKESVLKGGEKAFFDNLYFAEALKNESWGNDGIGVLKIPAERFFSLSFAVQRRLILKGVNELGFGERFPFYIIKKICLGSQNRNFLFSFKNIEVSGDKKNVFLKVLDERRHADEFPVSGFEFALLKTGDIASVGKFSFSAVSENLVETAFCGKVIQLAVNLPVCVRSFQSGDFVRMADGAVKKIADIFSDWKVAPAFRCQIPVVQEIGETMEVKAVFAEPFSGKNWIVI